jgi:hypothetical protein
MQNPHRKKQKTHYRRRSKTTPEEVKPSLEEAKTTKLHCRRSMLLDTSLPCLAEGPTFLAPLNFFKGLKHPFMSK